MDHKAANRRDNQCFKKLSNNFHYLEIPPCKFGTFNAENP